MGEIRRFTGTLTAGTAVDKWLRERRNLIRN
jgi:hypothetical protein